MNLARRLLCLVGRHAYVDQFYGANTKHFTWWRVCVHCKHCQQPKVPEPDVYVFPEADE